MEQKYDKRFFKLFFKGITGAFQVNIENVLHSENYTVREHDDSGVYRAKYNVVKNNNTHTVLQRKWTNFDYDEFADGTPTVGEHNIKSHHNGEVHIMYGQIHTVHRTSKAFLKGK